MKAAIVKKYGLTDVINIEECEVPTINNDQILVKVENSSINYADHATLTGSPFLIRASTGLVKPKVPIIGMDVAGTVEKVGSDVRKFKVGDRVFGDISTAGMGGYGAYAAADADMMALIPDQISFEDAAATPLAAVTALQGLRNIGNLKAGQKVLINGASGGVGSFAVQIAKAMGAEVTAICHKDKMDKIKSLNPDFELSIKMRLGLSNSDEGLQLVELFNDYPIKKIIIHGRVGLQKYTGSIDHEGFESMYQLSHHPVVYNGDVNTDSDLQYYYSVCHTVLSTIKYNLPHINTPHTSM